MGQTKKGFPQSETLKKNTSFSTEQNTNLNF